MSDSEKHEKTIAAMTNSLVALTGFVSTQVGFNTELAGTILGLLKESGQDPDKEKKDALIADLKKTLASFKDVTDSLRKIANTISSKDERDGEH